MYSVSVDITHHKKIIKIRSPEWRVIEVGRGGEGLQGFPRMKSSSLIPKPLSVERNENDMVREAWFSHTIDFR